MTKGNCRSGNSLEVISFPSGNARSDQQWQPYCYYFCDSDDHPLFCLARNIRASSIHHQTKLCVPSLFIRCSPHLSLHRPPCAVLDCLPTSSWLPSCVPDRLALYRPQVNPLMKIRFFPFIPLIIFVRNRVSFCTSYVFTSFRMRFHALQHVEK
jgi:hypothetical protein